MGKGKFPGPLPIIASGKIETIEQAATAKASGADAVYLSAGAGGSPVFLYVVKLSAFCNPRLYSKITSVARHARRSACPLNDGSAAFCMFDVTQV